MMPPAARGIRKIWIILAVAVAVRGSYLVMLSSSLPFDIFFADHLYYREWALRIASGELWGTDSFEQGPLYAYGLAMLYRLLGKGTMPVLAAQMSVGLLTVALTFECSRRISGNRGGLIAGLLAAIYGPFVFHEGLVMKTFLEPFLIVAALYACLRYAERYQARWLIASGAALGMACLLREVHVLFLPAVVLCGLRQGRDILSLQERSRTVVLSSMALALVILPATVHNYVVSREIVAVTTGGGEAFYMAFGPYAGAYYTPPPFVRTEPGLEHEDFRDEARLRTGRLLTRSESSRYWFREGLATIVAAPLRAGRLLALRALILGNDFEAPDSESYVVSGEHIVMLRALTTFGWIAGLGVLGVFVSGRIPCRTLLLSFMAAGVLGILLSYPFGRFRLVVLPIWIIFSSLGVEWVLATWRRSWRRAAAATLGAALLSVLSFLPPPASAEWVQATEGSYREDLRRKNKHRGLISNFEREIPSHPSDPYLYDTLASQFDEIGKLHEAASMYRRAIDLDPTLEPSHWRLINVLFKQGNHATAYVQARSFVVRHAARADGHVILGLLAGKRALSRSGEERRALIAESETHLLEAVRLDPQDPLAHYYRGKVSALLGNLERGVSEVDSALQLAPYFADALHLRSILETRLDHAASARPR